MGFRALVWGLGVSGLGLGFFGFRAWVWGLGVSGLGLGFGGFGPWFGVFWVSGLGLGFRGFWVSRVRVSCFCTSSFRKDQVVKGCPLRCLVLPYCSFRVYFKVLFSQIQ